eukprot:gene12019-18564_t
MLDALKDILAGAAGGAAGIVVGQPFDVVKVQQQGASSLGAGSIVKDLVRTEGVRSLWKGLTPPLLGAAVYQATTFASYAYAVEWFERVAPDVNEKTRVCWASAVSGLASCFVTTPIDAYKIALQNHKGLVSRKNMWLLLRDVNPTVGLASTIMRDVPATIPYFYAFEVMKNDWGCSTFHSGGVAGIASWALVIPMDTIKTRVQSSSRCVKPLGVAAAAREIFQTRGVRGFFRGTVPCVLRAYPVNGVTFTIYHAILGSLGLHRIDQDE